MDRPDTRKPLDINKWITVVTPHGAEITLYRNAEAYRVTALDCYTRRLRPPATFLAEQPARDQARVWVLELLRDNMTFTIRTNAGGTVSEYPGQIRK